MNFLLSYQEMDVLIGEIKYRLSCVGIGSPSGPNVRPLDAKQKSLLIRVIIFGAFYPNYFSRQVVSGEEQEREAVRFLSGLDPYSTVRLGSFPLDQPHRAYVRQIKTQVENHIFSNKQNQKCLVPPSVKHFNTSLLSLSTRNIFGRHVGRERLFRRRQSLPSFPSGR